MLGVGAQVIEHVADGAVLGVRKELRDHEATRHGGRIVAERPRSLGIGRRHLGEDRLCVARLDLRQQVRLLVAREFLENRSRVGSVEPVDQRGDLRVGHSFHDADGA